MQKPTGCDGLKSVMRENPAGLSSKWEKDPREERIKWLSAFLLQFHSLPDAGAKKEVIKSILEEIN